jgi:16S rRNA processing protein RimM
VEKIMQDKRHIGKIKQAHGLRGEVYVLVFSKDISWIKKLKTISIFKNEKSQTLAVLKAKPFKDGLILQLDQIVDRNQSEAIEGAEVWIDQSIFVSKTNETPYLLEIEGFSVNDKSLGDIGKVTGFSYNGNQDLLVVSGKSIFEIPFVDQFVSKIDFENKTINMDLPEGLIDINVSVEKQNDGTNES